MSEVDFKTYQLTYSKDADDMNNVVDDVDLLGSKIIDIQNDFSSKTNKIKIKTSQANTISIQNDNALVKFEENGTFENVKVKPRIVFMSRQSDLIGTRNSFGSSLGNSVREKYT